MKQKTIIRFHVFLRVFFLGNAFGHFLKPSWTMNFFEKLLKQYISYQLNLGFRLVYELSFLNEKNNLNFLGQKRQNIYFFETQLFKRIHKNGSRKDFQTIKSDFYASD